MRPLHENVIIKPLEVENLTQTKSGIFTPIHTEMSWLVRNVHPNQAIVISIADDIKEKAQFKSGDTVIYLRWGARECGEYLIINYKDIVGKIN